MTTSTPTRAELVRLANDLRLSCMRISRRVRFESDRELSSGQFSVLARLEHRALTNGELAQVESVSAPSMTRTTSCLVGAGYVDRAVDPEDGRQVILSLTSQGRQALRRIRCHRDEWMLERFDALTEDERQLLLRAQQILAKVANR